MWNQFILENVHFAVNIFFALTLFGTFWLYFDAWRQRRPFKEGIRALGFLVLSLSFAIHATQIESTILPVPFFGSKIFLFFLTGARIAGYIIVLISLILDPIQKRPREKAKTTAVFIPLVSGLPFLNPILAVLISLFYMRKVTFGLERHVKHLSFAFFILGLSEFFSLAGLFAEVKDVDIYNIIVPFGPVWILEHSLLFLAALILGIWVFGYLLKRFETQLFMIFTLVVLIIFLLTTVCFTGLLLKNLQNEALSQIETDVKVLAFSVESKKKEVTSDAQVLAQNPEVVSILEEEKKTGLSSLVENFLLAKGQSSLVVVDGDGQVLARGEDKERIGESLSNDPLIKRALLGETVASVISKDGVVAPEIHVRAAVPIKSENTTLGAVMAGLNIDNAFVDGVKEATGLDFSIYGNSVISATTLLLEDGKSRPLGINEESLEVKSKVLQKGENFTGSVNLLGQSYFGAFMPLKDIDNTSIGMLFVGKPETYVLQTAGRSIQATFIVAVSLIILSIIPSFIVAKYISYQIK